MRLPPILTLSLLVLTSDITAVSLVESTQSIAAFSLPSPKQIKPVMVDPNAANRAGEKEFVRAVAPPENSPPLFLSREQTLRQAILLRSSFLSQTPPKVRSKVFFDFRRTIVM